MIAYLRYILRRADAHILDALLGQDAITRRDWERNRGRWLTEQRADPPDAS